MLGDGKVSNHLLIRMSNKSDTSNAFTYRVEPESVSLIVPQQPFEVPPGEIRTSPLFLSFEQSFLVDGKASVIVKVVGADGYEDSQKVTVLGPGH